MRALRPLSKILMLVPLGTLIYDLVKEWFVYNRIRVRSLEQWWTWLHNPSFSAGKEALHAALGGKWTEKLLSWPAPVSLAILPVILYVIYWIWFKVKGGNTTGAYTYKSHD